MLLHSSAIAILRQKKISCYLIQYVHHLRRAPRLVHPLSNPGPELEQASKHLQNVLTPGGFQREGKALRNQTFYVPCMTK